VLAGGSNLLIGDDVFEGLVVKMNLRKLEIDADEGKVVVGAGCNLLEVIGQTAEAGLAGWEAMAGIPGTIGGAVRGNAGAFGTEMVDVVTSVAALDSQTGEVREFVQNECGFEYRNSFFKQNSQWIILSAVIVLEAIDAIAAKEKIAQTIAEREKRHLQDVAAAGSFFANPVVPEELQKQFEREKGAKCRGGRVPAGWLIEKVGLRGKRIGGAQSSQQHPNYIINTGSATAEHVIMLSSHIKQRVRNQFGVQLHEEVTFLM
jgi:UDP-N-acetylmuramate dehydrogenase